MVMKRVGGIGIFLALVLAAAPAFAHHMAVVVDKDNHASEISSGHLAKMFRGETRKWPDGRDVALVLHQSSPSEALTLERLTGMSPSEWNAFVEAHKSSILFVDSDADVLKVVGGKQGAIGLVEVRAINDQVNVLKVNGQLPMEAGYLPH
jgi:ABC-type phosphate transport system substrate-binding protein